MYASIVTIRLIHSDKGTDRCIMSGPVAIYGIRIYIPHIGSQDHTRYIHACDPLVWQGRVRYKIIQSRTYRTVTTYFGVARRQGVATGLDEQGIMRVVKGIGT